MTRRTTEPGRTVARRGKTETVPPPGRAAVTATARGTPARVAALEMPAERGNEPIPLSVVVPCYNEEAGLGELNRRIAAACRDAVGGRYELVLVNDGSRDGTWREIRALSETDDRIVGVNLSRNYGHQIALSAGLRLCRGERVLILDADLQDPPELLADMMRLMDDGADVVFGRRSSREGETWFKKTTSYLFYRLLARVADIAIDKDTGDFRLISRRAVDVLNAMPERSRFIRGMVSWIGLRQVPIEYERRARYAGETAYSIGKMMALAADAMIGFSIVPLRLAVIGGLLFGALGFVLLAWVLVGWLSGAVVQGWTSLMSIVLITGSVQLLVVGILGEYIGRLYMESKQRPLFIIDEIVGGGGIVHADPAESGASR